VRTPTWRHDINQPTPTMYGTTATSRAALADAVAAAAADPTATSTMTSIKCNDNSVGVGGGKNAQDSNNNNNGKPPNNRSKSPVFNNRYGSFGRMTRPKRTPLPSSVLYQPPQQQQQQQQKPLSSTFPTTTTPPSPNENNNENTNTNKNILSGTGSHARNPGVYGTIRGPPVGVTVDAGGETVGEDIEMDLSSSIRLIVAGMY